jgi:hypothetical protein
MATTYLFSNLALLIVAGPVMVPVITLAIRNLLIVVPLYTAVMYLLDLFIIAPLLAAPIRKTPAPRLVCVEHNPGPEFAVFITVVIVVPFIAGVSTCFIQLFSTTRVVPQPPLVGIETNPGPTDQEFRDLINSLSTTKLIDEAILKLNSTHEDPLVKPGSSLDSISIKTVPQIKNKRPVIKSLPEHFKLPSALFTRKEREDSKSKTLDRKLRRSVKEDNYTVPQMNFFSNLPVEVKVDEDLADSVDKILGLLSSGIVLQHNVDPDLKKAINSLTESLKKTSVSVPTDVSNMISDVTEIGNNATGMLALVSAFYFHYHNNTKTSFLLLILAIGNAYLRTTIFSMSSLKDFFMPMFTYAKSYLVPVTVPQVGVSELKDLAKMLSVVLSMFLLSKKTDFSNFEDLSTMIAKMMMDFDKCSKSVESSVTFVVEIINKASNFIKLNLFNLPAERWILANDVAVQTYQAKYDEIVNQIHLKTLPYTPLSCTNIHNLWLEGSKLLATLPRDSASIGLFTSVQSSINFLMSIKKKMEAMNLGSDTTHQEPYCVNFVGAPNGGKTMALQKLGRAIAPYLPMSDQLKESWLSDPSVVEYSRAPGQEFWDGFRGQTVLYFDEFGQETDVAGGTVNQYFEFIRIKNIFSTLANMASLEEKGNVRVSPLIMILSTNRRDFSTLESIISTDAVNRRFDKSYVVVPKAQYAKEETLNQTIWDVEFDTAKFEQGKYTTIKNEEMMDYHEYDFLLHPDKRFTGKIYTFDEVVQQTIKGIETNELRFKQFSEELHALREKHIKLAASRRHPLLDKFEEILEQNPEKIEIKQILTTKYSSIVEGVTDYTSAMWYYLNLYKEEFFVLASSAREESLDFFNDISSYLEGNTGLVKECCYCPSFKIPRNFSSLKDTVSYYVTKINTYIREANIWACLPDFQTIVKLAAGTVVAVFTVVTSTFAVSYVKKFISWLSNLFRSIFYPDMDVFSPESGNPRKKGQKGKPQQRSKFAHANDRDMQAVYAEAMFKRDPAAVSIADKVVRRNTYTMIVDDQNVGVVTFITAKIVIMPRHFLTHMFYAIDLDPAFVDSIVTLKKSLSTIELKFKVKDFFNFRSTHSLQTNDLVLVELVAAQQHCDIVDYFSTEAELESYTRVSARLVTPSPTELKTQLSEAFRSANHKVYGSLSPDADSIPDYIISRVYAYNAETKSGYCGSLLLLHDGSVPSHKIIGIHGAGSPVAAYGVAIAITQEVLRECLTQFDYIKQEFESSVPQFGGDFQSGKYTPLYRIDKPVFTNSVTKIIPSILHGAWTEVTEMPAVLKPHTHEGVFIEPMVAALDKYATSPVYIDTKVFSLIASQMVDDLISNSPVPFESRIYTTEEAILGIPGTSFGAISRSTSPGYPFVQDPRKKKNGKKDWLGQDQEYDIDNEMMKEIIDMVHEYEERAKRGIRVPVLYIDSLKDELRPFRKAHVPRLFNVGAFHYLVIWRKYFGSLATWLFDNKVANGFVVGVNPYSSDWDALAQKLMTFGNLNTPNIGAGDYSAFDASEKSVLLNVVLDMFNMLYDDGPENAKVRAVLFLEVTNSHHISGDIVYEWINSLPSGHPFTTIINNFYNMLAFRYCWFRVNKSDLKYITNFNTFIYLAVQGDDNIFSVHPDYITIFTEASITPFMAELGMTYTSDIKGAGNISLRKLGDVNFLKRKFRYELFYDRMAAPLDLGTILEMPFWTKNNIHANEIVQDNVNTALRELCLHDLDTFNEWAPKIIKTARNVNIQVPVTSRTLLLANVDNLDLAY